MDLFRRTLIFCVALLIAEVRGASSATIRDAVSLDMDLDLNLLSNRELTAYAEKMQLRLAMMKGQKEVLEYVASKFEDIQMPVTEEDLETIFKDLSAQFIKPALITKSRMEALQDVMKQRIAKSSNSKIFAIHNT